MFNQTAYPSLLLATLILTACGGSGSGDGLASAGNSSPTATAGASTSGEAEAEAAAYTEAFSKDSMKAELAADAAADAAENSNAPAVNGAEVSQADSSGTAVVAAATASTHLYVATTGSDTNPGTELRPFKTIVKASQAAVPGTVVHVAAGTYPGSFQTAKNGTATARITYVSDVKYGAVIVPPAGSQRNKAWTNTGNYVDIVGFQIDGTRTQTGVKWWTGILSLGSYNLIKNNYIHHIATSSADCTSNGGAGINTNNYNGGYHNDIFGNVVTNIGSTGCIYIHGIYMATSGLVKNNVVHSIGNWGIHLWHDAANIDIANNTVTKSGGGILVGGGGYYQIAQADYVDVSNNIVYGNARGIMEQGDYGTNNRYFNNLSYGNTQSNYALWSKFSGAISGDPQFLNFTGNDFRVSATSPAIDKGSAANAPGDDILGVARPLGGVVDLGAYEIR